MATPGAGGHRHVQPPFFTPGGGFHYGNTNYVLLGMVIEEVTGLCFTGQLEEKIIEPLELRNTYLPSSNGIEGRHASGYWDYNGDGKLDELPSPVSPSSIWAAGALV